MALKSAANSIHTPSPSREALADPNSAVFAAQKQAAGHPQLRLGRAATLPEGFNWQTFCIIAFFHAGALAALFFFTWQRLAVMVILYVLAINVGIGMCYHRLLTHRGYQVPKWLEYVMTVCATLSLEGGPIFWVATHRVHHQLSDKEGDPHTPREGGWWAHTGWLLFGEALHAQTEAARALRAGPEPRQVPCVDEQVSLAADRGQRCGAVCGRLGFGGWVNGLALVLWGVLLRVTLGLHATWLVNSATHMWGGRRFDTHDDSRNSWWVALLTGGEGWHNNHHAHPVSARHGLAWWELDPNFWGIWILSKLGLARGIKLAQFDREDPKPAGS